MTLAEWEPGDFTITGYSSDSAMKDFVDGSSSITEGEMFAEGTADEYLCDQFGAGILQ